MSRLQFLCFVLLCNIAIPSLSAQESDSIPKNESASKEKTIGQLLKYDGASALGGVLHAYSRPAHWKEKDFATLGVIVAGTLAVYSIDESANTYFTNQKDDVPKAIREIGFRFGKPLVNYGLTTGIYTFGLLTKNEKVRKTGVLLIASATAGGILQSISKTLVGRGRPILGEGNDSFKFYSSEAERHSFPSGHAILSFTTAYAIGKQFKNPYIKGGIYALGLVTPISRLWEGAHWLTDVGLGIALSIITVDSIDNYLNKKGRYGNAANSKKISWDLNVGVGQLGVVGRF